MRKLSAGLMRSALGIRLKTRGFRLAGASGVGPVTVRFPPALIRLQGWWVGQRLKASVTQSGVTLSVRWVPSALHAVPPRKRRAADRVRFHRNWQKALRALRRTPNKQRWTIGKKTKGLVGVMGEL